MGLLDDLLAGLGGAGQSGQPMGQPANQPQGQASGGGTSQILMALLPVVLAMLRSRGGPGPQSSPGQGAGATGLGLDDLLGSIFGQQGGGGGGLGGLGELLNQMTRAGFGQQADSWVGRGQNAPLPPDAVEKVFGRGGIAEIARRAGLSQADASHGLSQLLPEVVDRVTPEGKVPDFDALTASVDALSRRR